MTESSVAPTKKRTPITREERTALRVYARAHPSSTGRHLRLWFSQMYHPISQGTVSESLSQKYDYLDNEGSDVSPSLSQMRNRSPMHADVEKYLLAWMDERREKKKRISYGKYFQKKAERIWRTLNPGNADVPQFGRGWLRGFLKRSRFRYLKYHGESGSVNHEALARELPKIQTLVQDYDPKDVYNCDETGLEWKRTPDGAYDTVRLPGPSQFKNKVTIHLCCNADGTNKMPIWMIGRYANPRCFGSRNKRLAPYNISYRANNSSYMTSQIMEEWLLAFDRHVSRKDPDRRVLLLMDNFRGHTSAVAAIEKRLNHTKICFLPARCTSVVQPLDQGIIWTTKCEYRKMFVDFIFEEDERDAPGIQDPDLLLRCVKWLIEAWNVVPLSTITKCWKRTGLLDVPEVLPVQELSNETTEESTENMIENLMETSVDTENSQGSVYRDSSDSEADEESTNASVLIDDTEVEAVNQEASQVFQRGERNVESDDAFSVSSRGSLAKAIANLRRRGIISHDISLNDFVEPESEMVGNTSEERFDDFIRSEQGNQSLPMPTESSQDTNNSEVVVLAEVVPDFSKKHKEALGRLDWLTKYEEDQEVFDERFIKELKRYTKIVETRRKAQKTSKQSSLREFFAHV